MGSMTYLMLFEGNNSLPNRWGKHYNGWTIALFIIILLEGVFLNFPGLFFQVAVIGVLFFLIMSLYFYFKEQGVQIYQKLFRNE